MYRSFFGLIESPFKITPDLEYFYRQSSRDASLQSLKYAIDQGEGIIKVVGEVGAGKTTLLRLLVNSLPSKFVTLILPSPTLSPKEVLLFICHSFSLLSSIEDNKYHLIQLILEHLTLLESRGKKVILFVDESQSCSLDTLEEIRLLSNLETQKHKLIQIILFGQIELDVTLGSLVAKPLKARISSSIYLDEFTVKEVHQYLNYRMRVAGYSGEDLFDIRLAKEITRITKGLPRAINIIADKLLLLAYSRGERKLSVKLISHLPHYSSQNESGVKYVLLGLVFILVSSVGSLFYYREAVLSYLSANNQEYIQKESVFDDVYLSTKDVYTKIPAYFYSILLLVGHPDHIKDVFFHIYNQIDKEDRAKVFIHCELSQCYIFFGYSNSLDVVQGTANNLSDSLKKSFKVVRLSNLDAIIP